MPSTLRSVPPGFVSKSWSGNLLGLLACPATRTTKARCTATSSTSLTFPASRWPGSRTPSSTRSSCTPTTSQREGVSRHEPGFQTQTVVGRLDAYPTVSLPTFLRGWTFRPEVGVRETFYTERLIPTKDNTGVIGVAVAQAINRNVLLASMEVRPPSIAKIFDRKLFGYVMKHVVEPYAIYRYETGINNFANIIRFDYRDILADSSGVEYGVVNRLYAKKSKSSQRVLSDTRSTRRPTLRLPRSRSNWPATPTICDDKSGPAKEVVTWTIAQKYFFNPTFGGALGTQSAQCVRQLRRFQRHRIPHPAAKRFAHHLPPAGTRWRHRLSVGPGLRSGIPPGECQHNLSRAAPVVRSGMFWAARPICMFPAKSFPPAANQVLAPDISNQFRVQAIYGSLNSRGFSAAGRHRIRRQERLSPGRDRAKHLQLGLLRPHL